MSYEALRFSPGPGFEWDEGDMLIMMSYIQHVRSSLDPDKRGTLEDPFSFESLDEGFIDQVLEANGSGALNGVVEIYSSQLAPAPTWKILPIRTKLSVWNNGLK